MLRFGLKGKMLFVIISLLVVSFSIVAVAGYLQAKNIIVKQSESHLITKTDYMREKVTDFFNQRQIILANEANLISGALGASDGSLKSSLPSILATLKDEYGIIDIYVGYPDGSIDCGTGWVPDEPGWRADERPWYKAAMEANGEQVYTDVYIDSETKKPVVTISQAVKGNNGQDAVVAVDIGLAQLAELFSHEKIGETGYPFVLDKDGRFLIHPTYSFAEDLSTADTIFNVSNGSLKVTGEKLLSKTTEIVKGEFNGEIKIYYSENIKGTDFYLFSTLTEEDFTRDLNKMMLSVAVIFGVSIVLFIIFILIFIGRITKVIKNIAYEMKKMAEGNLNYTAQKVKRRDELGDLAKSINTMQHFIRNMIQAVIAETDNVNKALAISGDNISELSADLEEASSTVEQLSAGMEETASSTQEMSATTAEIENAIELVAKKAQEGAVSAGEISLKALKLKNDSVDRQNEATEAQLQIKAALNEALSESKQVEKIKELSEVILQISSKTNLLALNAAIEAARAGEAGRGFSVVAEEIRNLSESSKSTVNEIQETVNAVFGAVNKLVEASKEVLDYIETKVVEGYKESVEVGKNYEKDAEYVNELVTDLSATSEEVLASIKTISEVIEGISKASSEGAAGTSDIAGRVVNISERSNLIKAEISNVQSSADNLKNIVSRFKV
jgi:methyl-accepting chemotaxis protein